MKYKSFLILSSLCLVRVYSQMKCSEKQTCGECIGFANDRCVWCSQPDLKEKRCQSIKEINARRNKLWCQQKFIEKPGVPKVISSRNDDFNSGIDNPIQFKPQTFNVIAHPGVPIKIAMSYKPVQDFPLDVYYLMDYSYTMKDHMEVLQDQGTQLYSTLTKFTNNVRFGIGGFVEKPGLPYADPVQDTVYSFQHYLSLTQNIEEFKNVLSRKRIGSNYDDPEAGLDALMQVMACEDAIKWRKGARKIIILCTDSTYHSAGDGKIVGAFKPNDMKCHLNSTGANDADLIFDYPSVSQINKMAMEGNFLIIFAALNKVKDEYTALASAIRGAKYAVLAKKSNIITIIKEAYLESVRDMELLVSDLPPNVELSIEPNCTKSGVCKIVHNQVLDINGTIKITSCEKVSPITVYPMGLNDRLTINLNVDCECECEKRKNEISSPKCSSSGIYQCGVCKCNHGSYGEKCQCSGNSTTFTDIDKCKASSNDTQYCSGKGICNCGKCEKCSARYSGEFCQFDDNACERVDNKLCAGKGRCYLGKCECESGWKGSSCSCPDHNFDCIAPYSKEICSGSGNCECGKCVCTKRDSKNELHGGTFCDICDDCAEKRCKELEEYVYCNFINNKTFCDHQYNETNTVVIMVNKTEMKLQKYVGDRCKKMFDNGTFLIFKHNYDDKLRLFIQKELEVPPKANIWVAVGSAIGVVLLIGLLTIIAWKILVDMHDAKEYEKFSSDAQEAGFVVSQNPTYIPPAQNFTNPMFEE